MQLPARLLQPFLGARIVKTGLAVFLTFILIHPFWPDYVGLAAVAAVLAIQPSIHQARQTFMQQQIGNVVGGIVTAIVGHWLGVHPITLALGVIIALGLLSRLHLTDAAPIAVVVVIFAMERPHQDFLLYTFMRMITVASGMAIGYGVNRFVRPPKFASRVHEELQAAGEGLDTVIRHVVQHLGEPAQYAKEQIKSEAASVQKRLESIRDLLNLAQSANEEGPPQARRALELATAGLFVFLERLPDIHRVLLQVGGLSEGPERSATADALQALILYRQSALTHALSRTPPNAADRQTFMEALLFLEDLVEHSLDHRETRRLGLALHVIALSLRHMGKRMEMLDQLLQEPMRT